MSSKIDMYGLYENTVLRILERFNKYEAQNKELCKDIVKSLEKHYPSEELLEKAVSALKNSIVLMYALCVRDDSLPFPPETLMLPALPYLDFSLLDAIGPALVPLRACGFQYTYHLYSVLTGSFTFPGNRIPYNFHDIKDGWSTTYHYDISIFFAVRDQVKDVVESRIFPDFYEGGFKTFEFPRESFWHKFLAFSIASPHMWYMFGAGICRNESTFWEFEKLEEELFGTVSKENYELYKNSNEENKLRLCCICKNHLHYLGRKILDQMDTLIENEMVAILNAPRPSGRYKYISFNEDKFRTALTLIANILQRGSLVRDIEKLRVLKKSADVLSGHYRVYALKRLSQKDTIYTVEFFSGSRSLNEWTEPLERFKDLEPKFDGAIKAVRFRGDRCKTPKMERATTEKCSLYKDNFWRTRIVLKGETPTPRCIVYYDEFFGEISCWYFQSKEEKMKHRMWSLDRRLQEVDFRFLTDWIEGIMNDSSSTDVEYVGLLGDK